MLKQTEIESYSLLLKNDKVKQYNRFAIFINLLNFLLFLAISYYTVERRASNIALSGAISIAVSLMIHYFLVTTKKHKESVYLSIGFFLAIITWVQLGHLWGTVIMVMLSLLYLLARNRVIVYFNNDHVVYSTIPKKIITWEQLSNVMLKDGLLTIDYRSNKILQAEIVDTDEKVDEKEFNEFCSQRLRATAVPA